MLTNGADLIWWREGDEVPVGGDLTEGSWQLRTPAGAAVRAGRLLDDAARKDIACVLPPIVTEGVAM